MPPRSIDHRHAGGEGFPDDERRILNPYRRHDEDVEIGKNGGHAIVGDDTQLSDRRMTKARLDRVGKAGLAMVRAIAAQEIYDNRT